MALTAFHSPAQFLSQGRAQRGLANETDEEVLMARGVNLGPRSRVDPAGKARGGRTPRTEVPVPRFRAKPTRDCSPHGYGHRYRRSRRGGR